MSDIWDEPGRYVVEITETERRSTPWRWEVTDNKTGASRFGHATRESWARFDADKALRKMRAAA